MRPARRTPTSVEAGNPRNTMAGGRGRMRSRRRRRVAHVFQIRNVLRLDSGSVCTTDVTGVRKTSLAYHAPRPHMVTSSVRFHARRALKLQGVHAQYSVETAVDERQRLAARGDERRLIAKDEPTIRREARGGRPVQREVEAARRILLLIRLRLYDVTVRAMLGTPRFSHTDSSSTVMDDRRPSPGPIASPVAIDGEGDIGAGATLGATRPRR